MQSHLHLALSQVGLELLGGVEDFPLVTQQVHSKVLDVSDGDSTKRLRRVGRRHQGYNSSGFSSSVSFYFVETFLISNSVRFDWSLEQLCSFR